MRTKRINIALRSEVYEIIEKNTERYLVTVHSFVRCCDRQLFGSFRGNRDRNGFCRLLSPRARACAEHRSGRRYPSLLLPVIQGSSLLLVDSTTLRLFFSADSTYDSSATALSYNGDTMTPGSEGNYILSNYSKSGTLGDVVTALYDYSVKSGACFG